MATASATICPLCGAHEVSCIGPVIHAVPTMVNAYPIDLHGIEFNILKCGRCGFWFKSPPIPEEKLLECYAKGAHLSKQSPEDRSFDTILSFVKQLAPGRRVLDVGCDTGALLEQLGNDWQKFGVEPSSMSAEIATAHGTTILGGTLDERTDAWGLFDAILLIDVMEHIPKPMSLLRQARNLLNPGGVMVIATGDTSSFPFKLEKNLYWYPTLLGHVSFFGPRAIEHVAGELGMNVAHYVRGVHSKGAFVPRLVQTLKNFGYMAGRSVRGFGLPGLRKYFVDRAAPSWFGAKDHMFVALKAEK